MKKKKLSVGSCFSGIGGLELGLERTGGFETRWQIEIDPYASAVLAKHWPSVKRYSDITAVDGGILEPVDLICGGFPCQDVSVAGKRSGLEGKRTTLWSELFRLVCEVRPKWLLAENVPGLLSSDDGRFFGNILRDLASIGFDAEWGVLSAAGAGAPHLRRRMFIVAYPNGRGLSEQGICQKQSRGTKIICSSKNVADATSGESGFKAEWKGRKDSCRGSEKINCEDWGKWWSTEPSVGRVAHGVPSRMDRLKCLGNAVVPAVAQKIGEMILRREDEIRK